MAAQPEAERWNFITHFTAFVASVLFSAWIMSAFARDQGALMIVSSGLFCLSMMTLYAASSLYHLAKDERRKRRLKVFDHSAIFVLIAGTYSPFTLAGIGGAWGWSLFGVIWGLAVLGVTLKAVAYGLWLPLPPPPPVDHLHAAHEPIRRMPRGLSALSLVVYLAMGWLIVIAIAPLWRSLSPGGLAWLFAGGACYTVGAAFYGWRSLRFHHAVWHLWVMAGSACHVAAVLWHVIPGR